MNKALAAGKKYPQLLEKHALRRKYLSLKRRLAERKIFYLCLPSVMIIFTNRQEREMIKVPYQEIQEDESL